MIRNSLAATAATAAATAAVAMATVPAAASAAEVAIAATGPVVELTVSEEVGATPDIVNISAGVNSRAMSASEAFADNAARMERVVAAIEGQGVEARDIRTSEISLNPRYEYDGNTREQVFRGYEVSSTVQVRLRDLRHTGRMLDAVVGAGADEIGSISWSVDDPSSARQQAREAAFATARERALGFARAAGYADVRLLEVSEGDSGWGGGPQPFAADAAVNVRNVSMPIRPGEVTTGVTISVKYEMTR